MKKRVYILTAVTAYFIFLIATIPAKPVTDMVNNNNSISIQGVSGTLWNGKAYAVTINKTIQLKKTEWSFTAWKLLIGQIAVKVNTRFMNNNINTELGTSFTGRYFVNKLNAKLSANDVAQLANIPLVQLSGLISLDIEHAQWKQGELPLASGQINWNDATITVADTASLGNVSIILGESEQRLLIADIKNQGGDIRINGTAKLVPEADYAVSIKLSPTPSANNNIKQSLGLFAKQQNNGDYLFENSGPLNQIGIM